VNVAALKTYTHEDLKTTLHNVQLEDTAAVKEKNQKLQRLQQSVTLINSYAKQHRLRLYLTASSLFTIPA